jgi:HAD superfamily hydrolase (TIGR01509 family)
MDGLLVDSEPLWTVAETELAERYGSRWDDAIKAACIGHRLDSSVPIMLRAFGVPADPGTVADAARFLLERMTELLRDGAPLQPGATELIGELDAAGVPSALVSSSYRPLVDAVLDVVGRHHFAVTVAGDEVRLAKPDPEPYRTAAARLGVPPHRACVLEDSTAGAVSATAAGCACVLVPTAPRDGVAPGPWAVFASLTDVSVPTLSALVGQGPSTRPKV